MVTQIKPFESQGGYTSIHNAVLDFLMPTCKPNTWKVVCAIIRKTIGWHKDADVISLSQLHDLTGIASRETLVRAIDDAIESKIIVRHNAGSSFAYRLNRDFVIEVEQKGSAEMALGSTETVLDEGSTETVPVRFPYRNQYGNRTDGSTETVHTKEILNKLNTLSTPQAQPDEPPSEFDIVERWFTSITGILDYNGTEAIKTIVAEKITEEDLQSGYDEFIRRGNSLRYWGTLVGWARTAKSKRVAAEARAKLPQQRNNRRPQSAQPVRRVEDWDACFYRDFHDLPDEEVIAEMQFRHLPPDMIERQTKLLAETPRYSIVPKEVAA